MKDKARFIYSEDLLRYRFGDNHPFDNRRLKPTLDLIRTFGRLEDHHLHPPRPATEEELILVHDSDYICLVKEADRGDIPRERLEEYGLGTEDNPVFPGIHQTSALVTGGTLEAAEIVMSGQARHALNLSGGLHHALRGKASGFCIYNDAAVAIAQIRKKYQARVLYIDTDAHHKGSNGLFTMILRYSLCPSMRPGATCSPEPEMYTNGATTPVWAPASMFLWMPLLRMNPG